MTLNELKIGETAIITDVGGEGALRQHFLDMGIIPGADIKLVKFAPMGDPMQLIIHGYELTLRINDAKHITVIKTDSMAESNQNPVRNKKIHHPGFGEEGKYHVKTDEEPFPKGTVLTFALAGNQNCGKTTLFNALTGANQHVGNFPGVTVDRKTGVIKEYPDTLVTDLPGIYSLSPYTSEEVVSRQFILEEKPACIINIVDTNNIERNLYLTMQLMELEVPMVLALNMMDEVESNGGTVYINDMEAELGIPVVPISASKEQGVKELVKHAVHIAKYKEKPGRTDFCDKDECGGAVHRALHSIMHLIEDHAIASNIPVRFAASKLVEGDKLVLDALKLTDNEKETLEHIIIQMEKERGLDRSAAIADMRFSFIKKLTAKTVVKPVDSKEHIRSGKIDKIFTGKFTAIPTFILIMAAVFWLTFDVFGKALQNLLELGIDKLSVLTERFLTSINVSSILKSLVIDGIFGGIGTVVSFVPIIIILFFFLSLLEDSGYMARVAFIMDKLLRKIGLSGRSIVPMLIGFGCTVPGVMASRTLPSARDRKMTVMLTPFMSCSAKLPIYGFLSAAFFPKYAGLVMIGLYFFGILIGIITALISKKFAFKGEAVPFVMELPNYRLPTVKNVMQLLWEKAKDFLQRAFTVILIAAIVVWALQKFDFGFHVVADSKVSMLASIAGFISPVFAPLGLDNWMIATALIAGFMAKESVVSTLSVLLAGATVTSIISPVSAIALLVFCLLYTPCVAAISAIRRELGGKWAFGVVIFQCSVAWVCAFIVKTVIEFII